MDDIMAIALTTRGWWKTLKFENYMNNNEDNGNDDEDDENLSPNIKLNTKINEFNC